MSVDHRPAHLTEPRWMRGILLGIALLFLTLFLLVPLAAVFAEAFRKGWALYLEAIVEPDAWAAIRLTLLVAAIALPVNLVFGVAAAWAITKFQFRGKQFLITLIDLPFSVSPVVAGWSSCCCSARRAGSAAGCRRTTSRSCTRCRASSWPACS